MTSPESPAPSGVPDPFAILGVGREAALDDVRAARRRLAFDLHPDRGGSAEAMKDLNAAFDAVVGHITGRRPLPTPEEPSRPDSTSPMRDQPGPSSGDKQRWFGRVQQDVPSFVIDALPAEAFEALLIVSSWIADVLVDDPPYLLEVHLYEPTPCWCRLDLVPDAGASTVSLTVAAVGGSPAPAVDDVRDVWVHHLNQPGAFT